MSLQVGVLWGDVILKKNACFIKLCTYIFLILFLGYLEVRVSCLSSGKKNTLSMKFNSPTNALFVWFVQGYIGKRVMAVKDSWKCRRLVAFVTEALEHRSPSQDKLLVVQWKMISPLDCQVGTGEMPCKWEPQGSANICVIWYLMSPLNPPLQPD